MSILPYITPPMTAKGLVHPRLYEDQATYRAYLFGPFRVFRGEQKLVEERPRRKKALMILKWFLLNSGKPYSADEFIDLFWPDSSPQTAMGNFHVTMHCLRRMLEPDLDGRQESAFIRRSANNFYHFEMGESWWTDAGDVEMLFALGQTNDAKDERGKACFYYRRVTSYCALEFLPEDDSEDLFLPYRRRYQETYSQALMRLMQLHMENNEREDLLDCAYQMRQVDRYNEMATRVVIDALLQSGNTMLAQRMLKHFRDSLREDLGIRPTKELCTLQKHIQTALTRSPSEQVPALGAECG
jgi:DNA-binding SARP family transcriptional activator